MPPAKWRSLEQEAWESKACSPPVLSSSRASWPLSGQSLAADSLTCCWGRVLPSSASRKGCGGGTRVVQCSAFVCLLRVFIFTALFLANRSLFCLFDVPDPFLCNERYNLRIDVVWNFDLKAAPVGNAVWQAV